MEAQFALYKVGILDDEVWELRRGYAQGMLAMSPLKEWWELDKNNSMFTRAFIESMDNGGQAVDLKFMGISSEKWKISSMTERISVCSSGTLETL